MSFLEKNKNILQQQYPGFWEDLVSNDCDDILPEDLKIETTASGELALCVRGIHVHSQRDPLREGQRLAESVSGEKGFIIIFGFGLG